MEQYLFQKRPFSVTHPVDIVQAHLMYTVCPDSLGLVG